MREGEPLNKAHHKKGPLGGSNTILQCATDCPTRVRRIVRRVLKRSSCFQTANSTALAVGMTDCPSRG